MLRILLVCAVVILVAGGGAAGWWFGLRGESFPFASAQASEGDPEEAETSGTVVDLDPLTFPVMRDGQVRELVSFMVQVEVADESAGDAVRDREPVVRDAMLSELHGLYAYNFIHERADKMDLVKQRLLRAAQRTLEVKVRSVHLKDQHNRPQQAQQR